MERKDGGGRGRHGRQRRDRTGKKGNSKIMKTEEKGS